MGAPVAGQGYTLNCTVTVLDGITSPVIVEWQDSNGPLSSAGGITISETIISGMNITRILEFNPLRDAHDGHFICEAQLASPSPPYTIVEYAELDIVVPSMF